MRNKTRIPDVIMACVLALLLLFTNAGAAGAAPAGMDAVVSASLQILCDNEGGYNSVNPDDNGALSIGKLQWHGWRALSLLQTIVEADESQAQDLLGQALYKEITTNDATKWSTRKLTTAEAAKIKKLLATDESKAAQDALGNKDISGYIEQGQRLGITNEPALVYFADLANQGGAGAAGRVATAASKIAGSYGKVTLNELHEAAISDSVMGAYSTRRFHTYQYAAGLGWTFCNTGDSYIPHDYTTAKGSGASWIQRSLNQCMKAKLTITGIYDTDTTEAVRAFQSAKSLEADGVAGKDTITALIKAVAASEKVTPQDPSEPSTPATKPGTTVPTVKPTMPTVKPATPSVTPEKPTTPSKPSLEKNNLKSAYTSYVVNDTEKSFSLQITSSHNTVPVTYQSSDTAVVKVGKKGKVTVKGTGQAYITVSQAQTKVYQAASLTITVTVCSTNPADYQVPAGALYAGKYMQKQDVQWLQAALIKLEKASITVNGVWSDSMTKLVTDFQLKWGMPADGIAGDQTKAMVTRLLAVKGQKPEVSIATTTTANKLSWKKYAKANRVFIFRRQNQESYKRIKTIKNMTKTSFQDKQAAKGVVYDYTVKYAFVQNKVKVTGPSSNSVQGTVGW